ncbi:MAG: hypothetical protein AAGJ46_07680 [Planctomycetota bacterium]
MSEILFGYDGVNFTTWAYLSSLLSLALFFKFGRFWTLRNLDLLLVILLAPALLLIKFGMNLGEDSGRSVEELGYVWLLTVNTLLLVRMLLDPAMVRRPLLEPNLTAGGTAFLCVSLLLFLFANILKGAPGEADLFAAQRAQYLANLEASELENSTLKKHGPGFTFLYFLPHISTQRLIGDRENADPAEQTDGAEAADGQVEQALQEAQVADPQISPSAVITARVMAILSQLGIVVGVILIAARHFGAAETGLSVATFYLMLPYTAMWTGSVHHALPGALLVWAILFYRRPVLSGIFIGLLCGTIYHAVFLLPLWVTFYWRRGVVRFSSGVAGAVAVLVVTLIFTASSQEMFFARLQQMFNLQLPPMDGLAGVWGYWNAAYRWPLFALFIGLSFSFILWPAQKNLGTLLSCSAALMLGTQFWHAHSGGMALAWYLPVLLLTVFRPNLEDRVAVEVVTRNWRPRARAA